MPSFDDEEYEAFDLDDDLVDDDDEDDADEDDDTDDTDDEGDEGEDDGTGDDDADETRDSKDESTADDGDDDDDDDEDDDDDDLEDAADDEIDFVVAAYREDGQALVQGLAKDLANDLDELIVQLRRLPADAGALGFVSLVEEVFVIVRVRGQHVQVVLSDGSAAGEWPIARDIADLLDEDIPDEDDDDPMGDLGLLTDLGVSDFDLSNLIDNLDLSSAQMLTEVAERIKVGREFRRVTEAAPRG